MPRAQHYASLIYERFDTRLWLDLETRNEVDINTPVYTDTAEILLFLWAIDNQPVQCWDTYHEPEIPPLLKKHLLREETLVTHFNGRAFDTRVIKSALGIRIEPERQDDIIETALRYNLPASLAKLGAAVDMAEDEAKDKAGKHWIDLFCIPLENKLLKPGARYPADFPIPKWVLEQYVEETGNVFAEPDDFPIEYAYFKRYGKRDVSSMRTIFKKLPKWNDTAKELEICAVNHRINERGIRVDTKFAGIMAEFCKEATKAIDAEIKAITGGIGPRSHKKYLLWLQEQMPDVIVPGTGKPVIERIRKEEIERVPDHVLAVWDLQEMATANSLSKYAKAVELAHPDDLRVRFNIAVRGAGTTGRYGAWGGLQVHNFNRPKYKKDILDEALKRVMERRFPKDLLKMAPSLLRSMLIPSPGNKFRNADLSSIEGRSMCWIADFEEQIYDYANGINAYFKNGPLFGFTYEQIAAFKDSDNPEEYNIYMLCKVCELALIYSGGVSALCSMGAIYGLNMKVLADLLITKNLVSETHMFQAKKAMAYIRLTKKGRNSIAATRLNDQQWMALDSAKRAWRERHPGIVSFWDEIDRNLLAAFENPGEYFDFGRNNCISMVYLKDIGWFGIRLPSGRILSYYDVKLGGADEAGYDDEPEFDDEAEAEEKDNRKVLLYRTFDKQGVPTKKYKIAHRGILANNINQGTAASLLDEILIDMEYEDWNPVLHIHDQGVADLPISDPRTPQDLEKLMCRDRDWCPGLPLKAAGEYMERFAK